MENPLSWSETRKLINRSVRSDNPGVSVVSALRTAGVLKQDVPDLEEKINQIVTENEARLRMGFCGQSLAGQIENALLQLNAL